VANAGLISSIQQALEALRPAVQTHGGDVEFISFQDGVVTIKFYGACVGCPISMFTLKGGIEVDLKAKIPEVCEVVAIE
jgi:Fe-S cluster biogenesis protein NfuA